MATNTLHANEMETTSTSSWGAILLGTVLLLGGIFLLGDVVAATIISAIVLGAVLLVAGISEVFQAFSIPHWGGFLLRLLVGGLYALAGVMLIADPLRASVVLTLVFGVSLIASGVVRLLQAAQYWQWAGWLLLTSGVFGILAGLLILVKWPVSGLWLLGLLVGIDLVLHGIWWISLGWRTRHDRVAA